MNGYFKCGDRNGGLRKCGLYTGSLEVALVHSVAAMLETSCICESAKYRDCHENVAQMIYSASC